MAATNLRAQDFAVSFVFRFCMLLFWEDLSSIRRTENHT